MHSTIYWNVLRLYFSWKGGETRKKRRKKELKCLFWYKYRNVFVPIIVIVINTLMFWAAFLCDYMAWPICLIKCTNGCFLTKQNAWKIPIGMMFDQSINLVYLLQKLSVYLRFFFFCSGLLHSLRVSIQANKSWKAFLPLCAMNHVVSFIWIRTNWIFLMFRACTHKINKAEVRERREWRKRTNSAVARQKFIGQKVFFKGIQRLIPSNFIFHQGFSGWWTFFSFFSLLM